jgi:glycosyltransferase involved in cell wall biosynthesis
LKVGGVVKEVCVMLPALNEEGTIGMVIDEVPRGELERRGYKVTVVVIDNGSTDRTGEIAREKGARVVHEAARGKGRAVRAGFREACGDFVFMLDADYTYPATHITHMVEALENGCDVVMGSRLKGDMGEGAMSRLNMVGNRLLALLTNVLYGTRISDPCTGCWGFKQSVVGGLRLKANGFDIEADMLSGIARDGHTIAEVPIHYRRRATPPKLNSLRDGLKIGRLLVAARFRSR